MGIPDREERWKGAEEIFEMIEKFPQIKMYYRYILVYHNVIYFSKILLDSRFA